MNTLTACALGATGYRDGLRLQADLVEARAAGRTGDWLLFPDHPPVLTVGRGGSLPATAERSLRVSPESLARLGIELVEVTRGGDITWHGPGQLVGYPICDLTARGRDLHRFLRDLEEALIRTLEPLGLTGERVAGRTGVWVGGAKIASIGIAVRRWVSYHGVALNVQPDLRAFDLIHPCGLSGIQMTSLAALLGLRAPGLAEVRVRTAEQMAETLGYGVLRWAPAAEAWEIANGGEPHGEPPADKSSTRHAAA
jgi:lipoate-protein ligase B